MTPKQSLSLTPRFSEVGLAGSRARTVSTVSLVSPSATKSRHAFTIIELLVVLGVVALMVSLLATARAGSRPNFQGALCLNNLRQLMAAFTMYTHDYSDLFPPNPDSTFVNPGCNWVSGSVAGWIPPGTAGGPDAGNPDLLTDPRLSLFTPYIRTNISLFRCPFDPRICPYTGSDTNLVGQNIPVIRSISMNQGVGTKGPCFASGTSANSPVDGPWLNGSHSHTANNPYATFGKWSDFQLIRPSEAFVMLDDDPWTINDAAFAVIAVSPDAVNFVNALNNNSTCFSFADGHVETHKWKSSVWIHNSFPTRVDFENGAYTGLGYSDWFWLASHATRNKNTKTVP